MAVLGLCHLCPRPALANCFQCGRPTCIVHLDPAHQLCESCRQGRRAGGARRA
ncbi:MAG: hypothetical protein HY557_04695 [Euryarchaeota archaeon]|nr:hypothetical protein [Euryarchaeota archaeon]